MRVDSLSMLALLIASAFLQDEEPPDRTSAIYRCPAKEAETGNLHRVVNSFGYDSLCVDPKPGPSAIAEAKGKVKFVKAAVIDTKANVKWRDATLEFVNGRLSPRAWLARTKGLHETVHFLTNPKKPELRALTKDSYHAVFGEMFLLSWKGTPCITSGDSWNTRPLPDAGALQSWILAMNDWLGPLLQYRFEHPYMVTREAKILRADDKPGILIFRQTDGKHVTTVYCNNGPKVMAIPNVEPEHITIHKGIIADDKTTSLNVTGFLIEETEAGDSSAK